MMIKDGHATDGLAATLARAGADAVEASKRLIMVEASYGDSEAPTTVRVPYLFDGHGHPHLCKDAIAIARELHEREHPVRAGHYEMDNLGSLIEWAQRFKVAETTAAFIETPGLDPGLNGDGKVLVVIDELQAAGSPGALRLLKCDTRLRLHDRLREWVAADRKPMNIEAFSDFAMRAIDELGDAALITAISNVEVHEECKWVRSVDPESNAVKLTSETSKRTTKVPSVFRFSVPVFDGDDEQNAMTFTARLIIKAPNGKPMFTYEISDLKLRIAQAMDTIRQQMLVVTPHVYMGSPG